ncbi:Esterase EstD [Phycisphaerales bacterium]|nr:Esterase EstD [Phycisphaerales bacterium]
MKTIQRLIAISFLVVTVPGMAPPNLAHGIRDVHAADPERWDGTIDAMGTKIGFVLVLERGEHISASIAIPAQGLAATPVTGLAAEGNSLKFVLSLPGMPEAARPSFDLTLADDRQSASGTMKQHGMDFPVTMRRLKEGEVAGPKRPQMPVAPFPYSSREVTYENANDGAKLAGTLTIPDAVKFGAGPYPAVLLITGSGAQDRDESLLGHKPFLVLADALTRKGIVVLRADDRGVGGSTAPKHGEETTDDFVGDAVAGVEFLSKQPEARRGSIGLVGHSEGGLIAPMAAAKSPEITFIVLLAGTGVSGREVLEEQMAAIMKAEGAPEEVVARICAAQKKVLSAVVAGEDADEAIRELARAQMGAAGGVVNEKDIETTVAGAKKQLMSPWMRRFLVLDPRDSLRLVKCPVLVLNGSLDTQVIATQNVPAITEALRQGGNQAVTVHVLPGLNHLFQSAKTGAFSEYAMIEETMSPQVLELVGNWIGERASVAK